MATQGRKGNNRKQELINATLDCIAKEGLQKTTVRNVAEYANVTNGLIRFYFSGKDEMIRAAYSELLNHMYVSAEINSEDQQSNAKIMLCNFITTTLSPPIVSPRTVLLWANLLPMTYNDPEMAAIRSNEYAKTTKRLEPLIKSALHEDGVSISEHECEILAIKLNALIDGLWLEGSMAGYKFKENELINIGIESASAILSVDLKSK
ncbi:MAG: TetR family transcriptional regulator C-terminal domain-containing protein [Psychromonas sp.]